MNLNVFHVGVKSSSSMRMLTARLQEGKERGVKWIKRRRIEVA